MRAKPRKATAARIWSWTGPEQTKATKYYAVGQTSLTNDGSGITLRFSLLLRYQYVYDDSKVF